MSGQFENINVWAEKLQQVSLPDVAMQWQSMNAMLDLEMPITKNKDWKRWLLLIILLLLLIGVCNCPGIIGLHKFSDEKNIPLNTQSARDDNESKPKTNHSASKGNGSKNIKGGSKTENADSNSKANNILNENKKISNNNKLISAIPDLPSSANKENLNPHKKRTTESGTKKNILEKDGDEGGSINSLTIAKKNSNQYKKRKGQLSDNTKANEQIAEQNGNTKSKLNTRNRRDIKPNGREESRSSETTNIDSSKAEKATTVFNTDSVKKKTDPDSLKKNQIAINKEIKKQKDSAKKKEMKPDSVEDAKGFLFAVGLNQFFPIGDQQKSNYNSSGTTGGIGDYIPVPVARYYFHKWLYVQAEAQFNAPQYTKTLLANQSTSGGTSGRDTATSIFIKKLFYFNVPFSIHYSPVKNLYIGAGLQYSLLTNGVALQQQSKPIGFGNVNTNVLSPRDTLFISSKIENFKSAPAYKELKTYELRFLFDINYQWKQITLGLRYNQAFTNFINVHISNAVVTQAHNSSLQLYLRYTIWDHRKKFLLPK